MSQQVTSPLASNSPSIPDYECLRPIGRGAYGEVWLARNLTGSFVALKIVHRAAFDHDRPFEREFEGIQRFEPVSRSDPSQVAILHVGRGDGFFYYVMELADDGSESRLQPVTSENASEQAATPNRLKAGLQTYVPRTLKQDLRMLGALPSSECVQIALSLTRALAHLHGHGLVHRDVKPSNVIFVGGVPKLADIGLVASTDATMSFVGTSGFLPPEGAGTPQADLYSLGKVLYEISMGRDRTEFPKLPPNLAESADARGLLELNAVVLKACHHDPRQRYSSAQEMAADLVLLQTGKSVKRMRTLQQRWVVCKRVGIALVLLGLATATGLFFLHGQREGELHSKNSEAEALVEIGNQVLSSAPDKALKHFSKAAELDPNFAPAYIGIYQVRQAQGENSFLDPRSSEVNDLRSAATKLNEVAPDLAEARIALSWLKMMDVSLGAALAEAQKATTMRAASKNGIGHAHGMYGWYLMGALDPEAGVKELSIAVQLCPSDPNLETQLGHAYAQAHNFPKALEHYGMAIELAPWQGTAYELRGNLYEEDGKILEALDDFENSRRMTPDKEAKMRARCSELRDAFGKGDGPHAYWQRKLDMEEKSPSTNSHNYLIATYLKHLGRLDEAYDWLFKMDKRELQEYLWSDLAFDRSDPKFKELITKADMMHYRQH